MDKSKFIDIKPCEQLKFMIVEMPIRTVENEKVGYTVPIKILNNGELDTEIKYIRLNEEEMLGILRYAQEQEDIFRSYV